MDKLKELDPIIHPRTKSNNSIISKMRKTDFNTLKIMTGINEGVLSRNINELKNAKYIEGERIIVNNMPKSLIYYWMTALR